MLNHLAVSELIFTSFPPPLLWFDLKWALLLVQCCMLCLPKKKKNFYQLPNRQLFSSVGIYFHTNVTYYCLIYSIAGGGSKKDDGQKKKEDDLNIFSVASGHLYERFLRWVTFPWSCAWCTTLSPTHSCHFLLFFSFFRIMMVSVLRHTKTPVKFWFLKNYLSPSFKVCVLYSTPFTPYFTTKAPLFTLSVVRRPSLTWQRSTASSMS